MNAMQFAKGMSIGMGVGMAVGTAAGWMMHPQKKRTNNIVADAVRTVSDVTDTIRDTMAGKTQKGKLFLKKGLQFRPGYATILRRVRSALSAVSSAG